MPTTLQFRRGTATQNDAFTGSVGELTIDTTNKTVRVHDGSTAGGTRIATYAEAQSGGGGGSGLDSAAVLALISAGYIQDNQIKYTTVDFPDSAGVSAIITSDVDASFIAALGTTAIPNLPTSKITSGIFDSARIPGLSASDIVSGTIDSARLPVGTFTTGGGGSSDIDSAQVSSIITADVDAAFVAALGTTAIPDLPASKITSGIFDSARLPVGVFGGGSGGSGIDSAAVIGLVDSAYVQARQASGSGTDPIFKTISVAGQSDVVADTTTDTLTLVGSGVDITTNAGTDTITFTASSGTDSNAVIALIDSAYVQARETAQDFAYSSLTGTPTIPVVDTDFVDSARVSSIITADVDASFVSGLGATAIPNLAASKITSGTFDSARMPTLGAADITSGTIDSARIPPTDNANKLGGQAGSYYLNYNNFSNTPTIPTLGTDFVDSAETNTLVDARVTNDYLRGLIDDSILTVDGNGTDGGVTVQDGGITIRTGTGSVAYADFYCEVSNAHRTRVKSAAHTDYSGNVDITLPTTTGTLALTSELPVIDTDFVDSARVSSIITADVDASFVAALGTTAIPNLPTSKITSGTFDSARIPSLATTDIVTGIFDSARIPALAAADIASGTIDSDRLPLGTFGGGGSGGGGSGASNSRAFGMALIYGG